MVNQFHLPYCLVIEEGACERLNEILADCIPEIEEKKVLIATEPALVKIMQDYLETNRAAVKRAKQFYEEILAVTNDMERAIKAEKAFLANEDYLNAALSGIFRSYSSIQEFIIRRLDISEEEMKEIRKICLG